MEDEEKNEDPDENPDEDPSNSKGEESDEYPIAAVKEKKTRKKMITRS